MNTLNLYLLSMCLLASAAAAGKEWKNECTGYYQMELPEGLEVALYVVKNIIQPPDEPVSRSGILIQRTRKPVITFGNKIYENGYDRAQANFSETYYGDYKVGISSEDPELINLSEYKKKVASDFEFDAVSGRQLEQRRLRVLHDPLTPENEFNRIYGFLIKDYNNAFSAYEPTGYTLSISSGHRLYQFWAKRDDYLDEKLQTAENQWRKKEPEVKSLLSRFRSRELYEVPNDQGFCIPYGFIANDSGQEKHNMAVTYRLKAHPDVSIFFQTLTADPGPGDHRPNAEMSEKDYVTHFWNRIYGSKFRDIKLYGKGFTYPEIDGRKAVAAFAKFTRFDKTVDYGYVAYVKGKTPTEPTLMFYLIRRGSQATGSPPVDKKDLEKMAEHIVASIKHRQVDIHRPQ
ncbi:T6SS immunity protein Tli4 family protein [Pantoea endophytica]|uniref:T6SS immunity protein Tli4 family protein n=1 Tax=Pantoea endophytica TaxID=92488 RepID=UPI001AE2851D|nr:T6SS immunity protein Tli4 family protein [Pantoea endophytica]